MDHREELLKAFGLGAADLEANRAGTLSPLQASQLAASGTRNLMASLVVGIGLAAILAFVATKPLKPVQIILSLVFFLAVLAVGIHDFRRTRAAGAMGRVECLAGPIRIMSRGKSGWHLTVANKSFKMPVRFWNLQNGAAYRVYFVPLANRIVAMEPGDAA